MKPRTVRVVFNLDGCQLPLSEIKAMVHETFDKSMLPCSVEGLSLDVTNATKKLHCRKGKSKSCEMECE